MIRSIEHVPSAKEFNYLTDSVGWGTRKNLIIEEALKTPYIHYVFMMMTN